MFEFAIAQQRKHPPSRRLLASWCISCLGHFALLLILWEYPQLLRGGMSHWFRSVSDTDSPGTQGSNWRGVAVIGARLEMPPPEVLRKLTYDWNQKDTPRGLAPPIPVNLPPGIEAGRPAQAPPKADTTASINASAPSAKAAAAPSAAPPDPPPNPPTAPVKPAPDQSTAPKQIPKGLPGPVVQAPAPVSSAGSGANPAAQAKAGTAATPQDTQKPGVQLESGLFDTKGFPLQEWAELLKERIRGNWFIPSNLRNSQGSTTVIFYINREGQSIDVRIEISSGNGSLDIAALSAVITSNPFPPLPRGFPSDRVGARFVFAYNERK